jgi:hypothetical protein
MIRVDAIDEKVKYYAEDRDEDVAPGVLWDIAEKAAEIYRQKAPALYLYIRRVRIGPV